MKDNKIRFSGLGLAGVIFLMVAFLALHQAISYGSPAAGLLAAIMAYFGSDAMFFEISYVWTNGGLKDRYELWQRKRRWPLRAQMQNLRNLIDGDNRWLSHIDLAKDLTDRYLKALSDDWYAQVHESPSTFRSRLKLDPHYDSIRRFLIISKKTDHDDFPVPYAFRQVPPKISADAVRVFIDMEMMKVQEQAFKKDRQELFSEWSFTVIVQDAADIEPRFIATRD